VALVGLLYCVGDDTRQIVQRGDQFTATLHSGVRSRKQREDLWIKVPSVVGIRNPTLPDIGQVRSHRAGWRLNGVAVN
jgi:hypothetical protein